MRFSLAAILLLMAAASPGVLLAQDEASDAFKRGRSKYEGRDFDGAMVELNRAIELDPQNPAAYHVRGLARNAKDDADGALADFTKVIELNPELAQPYYARSSIRYSRRDLDGALDDLTQAIACNPAFSAAYNERGGIKLEKGDLEGALGDVQNAIDFDSKYESAYLSRARIKALKGDRDGALADFARVLELNPKSARAYASRAAMHYQAGALDSALQDYQKCVEVDSSTQDYPQLFIWIIRTHLGEARKAAEQLSAVFEKRWGAAPVDWPAKLAGHLCGKISIADLLAAAAMPDKIREKGRMCEAWFYIGMKQLLAGEKGAAESFQKAIATGMKNYRELEFAEFELKKLAK